MRKVLCPLILAAFVWSVCGCRGNAPSDSAAEHGQSAAASGAAASGPADPDTDLPAAPVVSAHSNDPRPLLVCFGDSLTAGLGTDPGQSYPDYLQISLDRLHLRYRVVNEGISGNTTKDGVERLP
jgi:acyl-CoA thioesterase I